MVGDADTHGERIELNVTILFLWNPVRQLFSTKRVYFYH
jgi:hypothetical protein